MYVLLSMHCHGDISIPITFVTPKIIKIETITRYKIAIFSLYIYASIGMLIIVS